MGVSVIELAAVIRDLRGELQAAMEAAPSDGIRFELGPVELEVTVGVQKGTESETRVRFWVVEIGVDGEIAKSSTQRVKLTLQPRLGSSNDVPFISGPSVSGER